MSRNICVYSSSSEVIDAEFFSLAAELGAAIGRRGDVLIFGGCRVGLMGAVARAAHQQGGHVVGIIPEFIHHRGLSYEAADELVVTADMRQRKAAMEARADAFVALPGGFGTLEEMLEIITLKQLQRHLKPVLFLNAGGFYTPLINLFEHMFEHKFARPSYRGLYEFSPDVASVFTYLENYQPPALVEKWFSTGEPMISE